MELRKCIIPLLLNVLGVTHTQYFVLATSHGVKQASSSFRIPPPCFHGWTDYINTDNPKSNRYGDDDESLARTGAGSNFCQYGTITDIDCKAIINGELVDIRHINPFGLACSPKKGFKCNRRIRGEDCEDFTVRFFCECGQSENPLPHRPLETCPELPLVDFCPPFCPEGTVCDGKDCVLPEMCPCFTNDIIFEPDSEIITKDCENCHCLRGGHSHCEPIECPDCLVGEIGVDMSTCSCICAVCPPGTVRCPTDGACIKEEFWCNGVFDCEDDETNCTSGQSENPLPPPPLETCPELPIRSADNCPTSCPEGTVCDGKDCVLPEMCPCFKNDIPFETSSEIITKDCKNCYCLPGGRSSCEPIECPECLPGQEALMDMDSNCRCSCIGCPTGTVLCPTDGACINKKLWCNGVVDCPDDETNCTLGPDCSTDNVTETDTCEMLGKKMRTFDGLPYEYEICNNVLMKELESEKYSVTAHKACPSGGHKLCHRELVINVDGTTVRFGPGIEVISFQNEKVDVDNLWLVSEANPSFELKKFGNSLIFRSFKYRFDVTWNKAEDAKITVSKCLKNDIVGLCGFYNGKSKDDPRMPNGDLASSGPKEFVESWAIGSLDVCKPPKYHPEVKKIANKTCIKLNEEPFKSSCSPYVNMKHQVEACMKFMPECLQRSVEAKASTLNGKKPSRSEVINECKCQAFESFVEDCEISKNSPIEEWRFQHDCYPTCPEGMVWKDCGPGCKLTCDNYHQQSKLCTSKCVPGCYCPSGLVLHQNQCVKPKMCHDCVCRGHGDPNYITFDHRYYAFQGKCTYILAQHQSSEDSTSNFKVLAQNIECPEEPRTSCIEVLIIHWNGHVIKKQKNKPVFLGKKPLKPEDYPFDQEGISITYERNESTVIYIKEINLVVRYFDLMYGFTIELPSFFYYNKTEGLCGTCNFNKLDDLYHRDGYVTRDIEEFAYSWLEGPDTRKNCEFPPSAKPKPRPPLPPGVCNFTGNPCEVFLDPSAYEKSCQNDVQHSQTPKASMCRSKFQYAQLCCERGVSLVKWLKQSGCESSCPSGMDYKCTSGCPKTCQNYETYQKDTCSLTPILSCVCPEGEVMKSDKCVKTIECESCDSEGHVIGDQWQVEPCTTCKCLPDRSTACLSVQCAGPPVCKSTEKLKKLPPQGSCCDIYKCVPKTGGRCREPKLKNCPPGQANVIDDSGKCPAYRCECLKHLCPPVVTPTLVEGENSSVVTRGCCPEIEITCNSKICRPPPTCNDGFKLSVQPGRCCNKFECVPQKKVCIYQHKYNIENGIQVDLRLEDYHDKEYEPGSLWQDGLCRKCSCSESNGQLGYSCSVEICPNPTDCPDAKSYVIEKEHVPGSCCPKYKRTHCISKGKSYKIGEKWQLLEGEHCKKIYSCNSDQNGNAVMRTTFCCKNICEMTLDNEDIFE